MPHPSIAPMKFAESISPQLGMSHDFTPSEIRSAGKLSTRVVLNDAAAVVVKVKRIVVNQVVPVTFFSDDRTRV